MSFVRPRDFESIRIPPAFRAVLDKEVARLRGREDVLAIGLCGSLAYEDPWPGADIDIEIVLQGDKGKQLFTTEQGRFSIDYAYFGMNNLKDIPYETSPIYDPKGVLSAELSSRVESVVIGEAVKASLARAEDYLATAERIASQDPLSAMGWTTRASWPLAEVFTLLGKQMRTHRRMVSRLDKATSHLQHPEIFHRYTTLLGFPETLNRADDLLEELRLGYREVWNYFKDKPNGLVYMVQQADSELWFRNRIMPLYEYDKRDLVSLVYFEFVFVIAYIFNMMGHARTPDNFVNESRKFEDGPAKWAQRYRTILSYYPRQRLAEALRQGKTLCKEARTLIEPVKAKSPKEPRKQK